MSLTINLLSTPAGHVDMILNQGTNLHSLPVSACQVKITSLEGQLEKATEATAASRAEAEHLSAQTQVNFK